MRTQGGGRVSWEKRRKRGKEEDKEEGEGGRRRDGWTKGKYFQIARQRMNGVLN